MNTDNELLKNLDAIHTTALGAERIKRNLSLDAENVVEWCKNKIASSDALITRRGKNWYAEIDGCIITVNAYSYTIITAHKEKKYGLDRERLDREPFPVESPVESLQIGLINARILRKQRVE